MIKRLAAGIYTWMPLGLRVLRKVEAIVREEMNRAGAIELLMPVVQPAELWQETGRWAKYGPELLRLKDRHERDFIVQPTSEEVITDIARKELKSYKQLPLNLYHIQTKFRDEVRPRFGVMRSREFVMKDAYSFDVDKAGDAEVVPGDVRRVRAHLHAGWGSSSARSRPTPAQIGGSASHEFQVLADSGEDAIAWCPASDYAANVELAEALALAPSRPAPAEPMQKVPTPGKATCEDVAELLGLPLARTVKCIMLAADVEGAAGAHPHAADPRRPRAERDQGDEGSGAREVPLGHRGGDRRGDRLQSRLPRPGRHSRRTCRSSSTARWP